MPPPSTEAWRRLAALMGYPSAATSMNDDLHELRTWIGFGAEDEQVLRALLPHVQPHLARIADRFYQAISSSPVAHAVFVDDAQIARLHKSLQGWLVRLLQGPWDTSWADRSRHIGQMHVRVGLPERYMFAAMNLIREDLCDIAHEVDAPGSRAACRAINRVTDLELCLMTGAYHAAHEDQELRALQQVIIQHLPMTVLLLDEHGLVHAATHARGSVFSDQARVGQHYTAFLPPQLIVAADLELNIQTACASRQTQTLPHVLLPGPPARHYRMHIVPLDQGKARLLVHIEDMTDALDAQARALQAESLARIGSMAAQLAHEIRNPIAGISGTLQVIVQTMPNDDRRREILSRVQEQVHRLDHLVRDLLNYARPASLSFTDTTLSSLARESLRQAAIEAEVQVLQDASIFTDTGAVHQILVNLLQNARDAAGEGGWIGLRVGPGPDLWVMDSGPGISAAVRDELFEPFVSTKTKGTGLGLAICRRRAAEVGGLLDLYEGPLSWPEDKRRGAVFRLRLPETRGAEPGPPHSTRSNFSIR